MEDKIFKYVEEEFDKNALPALMDYMRIPNLSPSFDPTWETNGLAQKGCDHLVSWITAQKLEGCTVSVIKEPKYTHLIHVEIEGSAKTSKTVLMYAHWDKQPPMEGKWAPGLGPFTPVVKDGLLYGRGGADDGYGTFAAVLSIKACQHFKLPHPKIVMLLESCEESGDDLAYYLKKLCETKIKEVDLVICLDSCAADPNRIWITDSLRGVINMDLKVQIMKDGVHSGDAGGIVPETFTILRELLGRIESTKDGKMIDALHVPIPEKIKKNADLLASLYGSLIYKMYPWVEGGKPETEDVAELLLKRTWKPALAIIGQEGLPEIATAGNVLRASTTLKLSVRLPPTLSSTKAGEILKETLTKNPPYGAEVTVSGIDPANGWSAIEYPTAFDAAIKRVSKAYFKNDYGVIGVGGSIPFIGLLAEKYPKALFVVTGAASSSSNEHAPNENLDLGYTKKFIAAISGIIHESAVIFSS